MLLFFFFFSCIYLFSCFYFKEIKFDAVIEGIYQNPPVQTIGTGDATFTYDTDSRKFTWNIAYELLESGVTMAHIHGPSELDENGGHLIDLEVDEYVQTTLSSVLLKVECWW